jgi:putative ATP-dependent endonuclease of OLD family
MLITDRIILKNYKCFHDEENGFESIHPINIIIGKNNSGKSSLLDLIEYMVDDNKEFLSTNQENKTPTIIIHHLLTDHDIGSVFRVGTSGGGIPGGDHYDYGKSYIGKKYIYSYEPSKKRKFISFEVEGLSAQVDKYIAQIAQKIKNPFQGKIFCKVNAERNATPEVTNLSLFLNPDGEGVTNYIQQIINNTNYDSSLIENELLDDLNKIIEPDISFSRILVQSDENSKWEIYFEDQKYTRVALSKMGSGIKTILLVLLNLLIRPIIEERDKSNYVFAFEELENNLHPALQRRLYEYIFDYSTKNSSYFFLTTHSNIVIDSFSSRDHVQLIHVTSKDGVSKTKNVFSHKSAKEVLKDIGIKASDLLQSNGIIWVEGPSDRNYINKWLKLLAPDLVESIHYSIMFYGGKLLSNLSFDYDWLDEKVVPLLKINTNAFVMIDRDGKTINPKLNKTKERIKNEIGENNCWITKGREIENYLTKKTIERWLMEDHEIKNAKFEDNKNEKLENIILEHNDGIKIIYNKNKTIFSKEISQYIEEDSLEILDLSTNLKELITCIRDWNSM